MLGNRSWMRAVVQSSRLLQYLQRGASGYCYQKHAAQYGPVIKDLLVCSPDSMVSKWSPDWYEAVPQGTMALENTNSLRWQAVGIELGSKGPFYQSQHDGQRH